MKRSVICIFLILLLVAPFASAKMVGTVNVPETADAGGKKLVLNGAGPRLYSFTDIMVYALYLPAKNSDAKAVIEADEPMVVKAWILEKLVTSDGLKDGYNAMFLRSMGRDKKEIQNEINTFNKVFNEEVKVGDMYEYVYIPGKGTTTYKNGKKYDTVPGLKFKQGLLGGWLAANAEDSKLKGALLGY